MTVELSKHELELLQKALEVWEYQAQSDAFTTSMMMAVFTPKDQRDEENAYSAKEMKKAGIETQNRKLQSILLRTKLIQAASRESEHITD